MDYCIFYDVKYVKPLVHHLIIQLILKNELNCKKKKTTKKPPKNIISGMISFKRQVASRFRNMTPPPVPPTSTHSFYCLQFFKEFSIAAMIKSYLNCLHI